MMEQAVATYEAHLSLGEKLSALRARRDMRELRLTQLDAMVGEAKKRVAKQPKAQEFLERLQERCHQKSVGLYEELLSAVVQDVLPGEKNVGLTLKTSRGLPSLDIEMVKPGGERESILEGSGGALTNILSAGLRVIALARSGAYPFLVLDEPDCWLKPTLVPQFANVLGQIAQDLGIQMLIISHHDPEAFSEFSSQVRLEKRGGALEARRVGEMPANEWDGVDSGIKELRLFDFMSHAKTVIPLSPGVTCLTGENDIGKSAIVSGLRSLFYGTGADTAIAHGKQFFKIEAQFHDDAVVSVERYLKKSPKQRWRYYVPGQAEPVQDSSPKDGAPEWLEHVAKIAKTEDLDIAFANQKSPVFLLDQAPSRRASILAVGRESMHLQRLIAKNKERNMLDARLIRDGESEGAVIKRELAELEELDQQADGLLRLRRGYESWQEAQVAAGSLRGRVERGVALATLVDDSGRLLAMSKPAEPGLLPLHELAQALAKVEALTAWAEARVDAAAIPVPALAETDALRLALPRLARAQQVAMAEAVEHCPAPASLLETERLAGLIAKLSRGARLAQVEWSADALGAPEMQDTERLKDMGRRLSRLTKVMSASTGKLEQPLERPAEVEPLDALAQKIRALLALEQGLAAMPGRLEAALQDSERLAVQRDMLFEAVGGKCPTCGSAVHAHENDGAKHGEEAGHE